MKLKFISAVVHGGGEKMLDKEAPFKAENILHTQSEVKHGNSWVTASPTTQMPYLPLFSLTGDFGKQNNRRNVSKISVNLTCYRHVGSKSTNHSH